MLDFFINTYKNVSSFNICLEILTFVFGVCSVLLARKQNILTFQVGLIATSITVYLLFMAGYYGDMAINFYYSIMSIYGWYKWRKHSFFETELAISRTNFRQKTLGFILFLITMIVVILVYKIFDFKIATENYFDIFTSGIFFTAMWFMALKKIENWTLWILGNAIVVPLYAFKGLYILAIEYIIFTILAILAYFEWKNILKHQTV